jgi:hypothetical protein
VKEKLKCSWTRAEPIVDARSERNLLELRDAGFELDRAAEALVLRRNSGNITLPLSVTL